MTLDADQPKRMECRVKSGSMQPSLPEMRHMLRSAFAPIALLLLVVLLEPRAIQAAEQSMKLALGQRATVQLEENPTTGYRWQIDRIKSDNLTIVRIDDLGFSAREGSAPCRCVRHPPLEYRGRVRRQGAHRLRISAAVGESGSPPPRDFRRGDGADGAMRCAYCALHRGDADRQSDEFLRLGVEGLGLPVAPVASAAKALMRIRAILRVTARHPSCIARASVCYPCS